MDVFTRKRFTAYLKENIASIAIIVLLAIVIFTAIFYSYFPNNLKLKAGDISTEDIIAPRTFTYINVEKTEELKKKVADSISPVYRLDTSGENTVLNNLDSVFNNITSILSSTKNEIEKHKELVILFPNNTSFADFLVEESPEKIENMHKALKSILYNLMVMGVKSNSINQSVQIGTDEIDKTAFNKSEKQLLIYLLRKTIQPNLIYDKDATEAAIQKAISSVPSVKATINKGDTIVKKGEKITETQYQILSAVGLVHTKSDWKIILSIIIFILLFIAVSYTAMLNSGKMVKQKAVKRTAEFAIIIVISYIAFLLLQPISPYLIPIPLLAFIIFAFFDISSALLISISFTFLLTLPMDIKASILFAILISISVSLFILRRFARMITLIYAGTAGGVTFALITFLVGVTGKLPLKQIEINTTYAFSNFFGAALLTLGIVFMLDHIFNEATVIRLLELSDTNTHLLRQLLLKAPGTYQHSINVASIAESAAAKINANSLLIRVGAYYHDIGKMLHPYYFTENQINIPNIHNSITPNLSKTIIINHVKDGAQIAKRYRLPEEIIMFILTHHGTTIVSYFYHKEKEKNSDAKKDEFRYPGPKPHTKEQAILMLADATEAATHGMDNLDRDKIEKVVKSIVKDRIDDGQLDQSELTLGELKEVTDSFIKSLINFYHKREAYPTEENAKS